MCKLEMLAMSKGLSVGELLDQTSCDSIVPGICFNPNCVYITEVEPDQDEGYCKICKTNTVRSCLSLAGVI